MGLLRDNRREHSFRLIHFRFPRGTEWSVYVENRLDTDEIIRGAKAAQAIARFAQWVGS